MGTVETIFILLEERLRKGTITQRQLRRCLSDLQMGLQDAHDCVEHLHTTEPDVEGHSMKRLVKLLDKLDKEKDTE